MSATKNCISCTKAIPKAAAACVYCGVRQPVEEFRLTTMLATVSIDAEPGAQDEPAPVAVTTRSGLADSIRPEDAFAGADADRGEVGSVSVSSALDNLPRRKANPSQTANTLVGLNEAALAAMAAADAMAAAGGAAAEADPEPASRNVFTLRPTGIMSIVPAEDDIADSITPSAVPAVPRPANFPRSSSSANGASAAVMKWPALARAVMIVAGVVLCTVFGMGASLLPALAGAQFILTMYYLVGGILLVGGGLLPLPSKLRATFAALVGAVPLFVAAPQIRLDGWRGLVAALVFLLLPGALLLRARVTGSMLARGLVAFGVALAVLLYLVPDDGVMPLSAALSLFGSGSLGGIFAALILLAPLGLAFATLTVFAGNDSSGFGNLWAILILLTASGTIVYTGMEQKELSLIHLGVGLLAAGSAGAVGVSQLLDLDSQTA